MERKSFSSFFLHGFSLFFLFFLFFSMGVVSKGVSCPYCSHPRSQIILNQQGMAGLKDRLSIISATANLAASLCAKLYIPPPCKLLSPRHNNNVRLSCSHNWDRYFTMTPLFPINNTNNNNTHKNIKSFKVSLGSEFVWGGEPENSHHFDVYIPPTQKQSYMVARKAMLSNRTFSWTIGYWYPIRKRIFGEIERSFFGSHPRPTLSHPPPFSLFPSPLSSSLSSPLPPRIFQQPSLSSCSYFTTDYSPKIKQIARQFLSHITNHSIPSLPPSSSLSHPPFLSLRIRSGSPCPHSPRDLHRLLNCTFPPSPSSPSSPTPPLFPFTFLFTDISGPKDIQKFTKVVEDVLHSPLIWADEELRKVDWEGERGGEEERGEGGKVPSFSGVLKGGVGVGGGRRGGEGRMGGGGKWRREMKGDNFLVFQVGRFLEELGEEKLEFVRGGECKKCPK